MFNKERFGTPTSYGIKIVETPPVCDEYIRERERIWEQKVAEGAKVGKTFFNGTLYRFMGIEEEGSPEPTVCLGLMTYADRLMKTIVPIDEIERKYGPDHKMIHACVDAILVTTDRKVVYGVKKMSVDLKPGKVGFISGNMNADEVEVHTFEDIYAMMMKEIAEEANIVPSRKHMSFVKLGLSGGWATFYFQKKLGISSAQLFTIEKDDEFDHFESGTPDQIVRMERQATSDFNYSKTFIKDLKL